MIASPHFAGRCSMGPVQARASRTRRGRVSAWSVIPRGQIWPPRPVWNWPQRTFGYPTGWVLIAGTLDNQSPTERVGVDDQVATAESPHGEGLAAYLARGTLRRTIESRPFVHH